MPDPLFVLTSQSGVRRDGTDLDSPFYAEVVWTRFQRGKPRKVGGYAQLSGQLTLWNQQGSHVLRGSLLVIPSGHALLYAEPIYLQAQQSPMPELRLVVLALQDKLVYGTTFRAALAALFGGEASSLSSTEPVQPSDTAQTAATPQPATSVPPQPNTQALITEAAKDFDDYQRLTAAGRLGEAGKKLDALKAVLEQLNGHTK